MSVIRRSLRDSEKPASASRPSFARARSSASDSAAGAVDLIATALSRFRQIRMMSSWIGSLAWNFGVATDISALTGWELTI